MARPGRPRNHDSVTDEIRNGIRSKDDDRAKKLIEANGIDILDGEACTSLIWAAFHDRPELLSWLIEKHAAVDHQDRNGYSALHCVAQEKHSNIARTLLDAGASTDLRDIFGNTPLWTAAFAARGNYDVFKLLLQHGASLDSQNNAGRTVREMALKFFPDQLEALIESANEGRRPS